MSPESLQFSRISKESDVWSYGILLWEIYSYGCTPYPSLPLESILEKLISGYRMEQPKGCDKRVYESLILNCWHIDPKKRLTFSQLVEAFKSLIHDTENILDKNLLKPPKAQPEEMTPFLSGKQDNQAKLLLSAQSSSSNWSECSTTISNSYCNQSSSSSRNQREKESLLEEKKSDNVADNNDAEIIFKSDHIFDHFHADNNEKDGDLLFKTFNIDEGKNQIKSLSLTKKRFFNLFRSTNKF